MAATLFAEPPSATLEEAVQHFLNGKLSLDFNFNPLFQTYTTQIEN